MTPAAAAYVLIIGYYTYMAKLTLSVDARVVSRAKQYAERRGVSISEMVEGYLTAVAEPAPSGAGAPPILRSVRGILKDADVRHYKKHLAVKYR
jgi:hypothetical protein